MKICVVGGGAREHALALALARTAEVVVTPGNPLIPGSVASDPEQIDADLYVVGPEQPLVDGLADRLRARGDLVFGPGADGARLEGSKAWMKDLLAAADVPTAAHESFTDPERAISFLRSLPAPWVVKTDGLAAGKGVLVTHDLAEAEADVRDKLAGRSFGASGTTVVIEEGMTGPELSLLAVCDGASAVALPPAQDFKRIRDDDQGPNTGGMGAYSPVPTVDDALVERLMDTCVRPTLHALVRQGIDYRGVLYCGLMLTPTGPRVVEFNIRFGDPETQVVLPRLTGDVAALLAEAAAGTLTTTPTVSDQAAVTVVAAAPGYPEAPVTGAPIEGLSLITDATVYAAGVAEVDGRLVTAGGRVVSVTGLGDDLAAARSTAYDAIARLDWPGIHYRRDIARRASQGEL